MKILIGCVNIGTRPLTEIWIETLNKSIDFARKNNLSFEIKKVIVCNTNEDKIKEIQYLHKDIEWINLDKIASVAHNWNLILKSGFDDSANPLFDYFLPANNDLFFSEHWLYNFIKCLEQDVKKEYGWISSFMNDYKEPDLTGVTETVQVEGVYWGGLRPEADDVFSKEQMENVIKATYARFGGIEKFANDLEKKYGVKLKSMHPKAPLFALSKECIKKVGLFDEYNSENGGLHEDADACKRIELAGFKIGCAYGAYAAHFSMMTRTKTDFKKSWWVDAREKAFQEKWGVSSKEMHLITKDKKFKLDIGSGERPQKLGHWYHLDIDKQFADVEFLHDASLPLPFEDESLEEIYCSNNLEHQEWKKIYPILFDWSRCLSHGGRIEIRVPNFAFACQRYLDKSWKLNLVDGTEYNLSHLIFGGEREGYPSLHKVGFDFENLSNVLTDVGFIDIKDISNQGSWEMRIEGIKA